MTSDTYPLEAGGVDDYPIKVGSMLLTLVDPNKGFESAYNRWYERDHYIAGGLIGPYNFAGSRWVATREMKDLRWGGTQVAAPIDLYPMAAKAEAHTGLASKDPEVGHAGVSQAPCLRWAPGPRRGRTIPLRYFDGSRNYTLSASLGPDRASGGFGESR